MRVTAFLNMYLNIYLNNVTNGFKQLGSPKKPQKGVRDKLSHSTSLPPVVAQSLRSFALKV
jgi:hypothetical protein